MSSYMILTSPAFNDGEAIPKKYSCDGDGVNPELQIQNVPEAAKSLALILHDPDAPVPGGFTHWVLWNINPMTTMIKEESIPPGSIEGRNSAGQNNYAGMCPPQGTHRYYFRLYALDTMLDMQATTTAIQLEAKIAKHIVEKTELVGLYTR